ncbi:MAG: hypothetical protein ACM3S2_20640, partial [Ignavibacteriales bacterium]
LDIYKQNDVYTKNDVYSKGQGMKTKKQISMKQYMDLQIRFIMYVSQTSKIDNLTAAEMYAPLLAQKIRTKYDVVYN